MGVAQRIKQIADNEGIKITALETLLGASKGVLSRSIKNDTDIQSKWLTALVENYPQYNTMWLLTGNGQMIIEDYTPNLEDNYPPIKVFEQKSNEGVLQNQQVPLYDLSATASVLSIFNDTLQNIPMEHIHIPNLPKCDGAIYVKGDSMYPLLKSGDIVLFKNVNSVENIIFGEMYVMYLENNGDEFFFVKYIHKSDKEGKVKLVSQNQHHDDVEFPVAAIKQLAIVKASVRINSAI